VSIAAASDLKFALDDIVLAFERQHPDISVGVTYGASGMFFAQLLSRAPFDLFLSADVEYPRKLVEQGQAEKTTEFLYAIGHLVVWVPQSSPLDVDALGIRTVIDPAVRRVAIANPRHAPYGRAAEAALKSLKVYDAVQDRLVFGESVAQAAQFVSSAAADAGIIALSLALSPPLRDTGRFWRVPADAHPPLEQGGVILSWARDRAAAEEVRRFMTGAAGRAILERYGFTLER